MGSKYVDLRLLNEKEEVLCEIKTVTYFDDENEFDEGETYYMHPLTASECNCIEQCFVGWSEQEEKLNEYWDILRKKIKNDMDLSQKLFNMDEIDYTIIDNLEGLEWGSLTDVEKELLLKNANCIDGETGNNVNDGECIIDLTDNLSVAGKIIDDEIIIENKAVIYNPMN